MMKSTQAAAPMLCFLLATVALAQTAPAKQKEIEAHQARAGEFLKNNQPDMAVNEFNAIVTLDPNNLNARNNLGVLLFFQGDYAGAIPQLRAALKLQPKLPRTQALLGMSEKRTGELAHAETDLADSVSAIEDPKLKVAAGLELVEIYNGSGNFEKAAGVVGMLQRTDPDNPDVMYVAYRIYSTLSDEAILSISMRAPKSARMYQVEAHELQRQGDAQGAIARYREALKIDPQLPGAHFELAEMLNTTQDSDGAKKEFEAALQINPFDEKAECRLGEFSYRASDLQGAAKHFSRALTLQPNDIDAAVGMGQTLRDMEQPAKALPLLEHAVKTEPADPVAHYQLGLAYRDLGRVEDSRREMSEFQKLKEIKDRLKQTYRDMRLQPKPDRPDAKSK